MKIETLDKASKIHKSLASNSTHKELSGSPTPMATSLSRLQRHGPVDEGEKGLGLRGALCLEPVGGQRQVVRGPGERGRRELTA